MLKARTPNVLVTVREGTTAHLFPALATGDLDIVVGRLPERELPIASAFPLTHEALFDESMCVVVGKGYGPAPAGVTHLSELGRTQADQAAATAADGTGLTFAQLDDESRRLAALLEARGLQPGDTIAILLENIPRFLSAAFWRSTRAATDPSHPSGTVELHWSTLPNQEPSSFIHT